MTTHSKALYDAYKQLSSLYKNPTRNLSGLAADNVDAALIERYEHLLGLFNSSQKSVKEKDPALYFKTLALLYEIDDYRGKVSPKQDLIRREGEHYLKQFETAQREDGIIARQRIDFTNAAKRSEWKAIVLCCVAAIEDRRRKARLRVLARELVLLDQFIRNNLHRPKDDPPLPAWTTLAFVHFAQARIARQGQDYEQSEEKLLSTVYYLDKRAKEIVERLHKLHQEGDPENAIEELKDDLVFIRRKQTLATFFNVGLGAFQRGFLRTANEACQAARLQFRLHGQSFQEVFNDLIILSINRARTSSAAREDFGKLKEELEFEILPKLNPDDNAGNPKLYLYGLRELAVLQYYYCKEKEPMLKTLERMEGLGPLGKQWRSRISNQRARAYWRSWVREKDQSHLDEALCHAKNAFIQGSHLNQGIDDYPNARALRAAVQRSARASLIDTIESIITYGSIQVSARNFPEALKSAEAIIQLSRNDNPRLSAMGYLVRAEAHMENGQTVEAQRDLVKEREQEKRVDHKYVGDRRRAIERRIPGYLPLADLTKEDLVRGRERLLGWFIENHTLKESVSEVANKLGLSRSTVRTYLRKLNRRENESEPFRHLIALLDKSKENTKRKSIKKTRKKSRGTPKLRQSQ